MKNICSYVKNEEKTMIYGISIFGKYCCDKLCEHYGEESVVGFIESTKSNIPFDGGKRVFTPREAIDQFGTEPIIIITGFKSAEAMKQKLLELGFPQGKIVMPKGFAPYFKTGYDRQIKKVCFWPDIGEQDQDVLNKISWFLPERLEVCIFTKDGHPIKDVRSNVVARYPKEFEEYATCADIVYLWDLEREGEAVDSFSEKIRVVDPNFYMTVDADNYDQAYYYSFDDHERKEMEEASRNIFSRMKDKAGAYSHANLLCTGPSIREIYGRMEGFQDGFNIICNSMVKDKELLARLQPCLLTFADTDFFVSPSVYAKAFYKDMLEAYHTYHFFIAVRERQLPLLLFHFPELAGSVIGVPYSEEKGYWFIQETHFSAKPLSNILTDMMVPIASAMFQEVWIFGCTGRNPDETYFWEHSERVQYVDLKPFVFEMWPGFFHARRYDAYYERHCKYVEELLCYGESLGIKYRNMTTSFIPALEKRIYPMVSVITVCKNSAETIGQTIESVLSQSWPNVEYIIIDGASEDGTLGIIEKYKEKLSCFITEPDQGMYYAMNKALSLVKGDVIGILNSDDWYEKDAVKAAAQCFQSQDVDVVYGYQNMVHPGGNRTKASNRRLEELWHGMPFGHPTAFVKKGLYEKYGYFDTSYSIVADHELMLRFYCKGARFMELPEIMANFRLGGTSSRNRRAVMTEALQLMLRYVKYCPDPEAELKTIWKEYHTAMVAAQLIEPSEKLLKEFRSRFMLPGKNCFIFGTGYWGGWIYRLLQRSGIEVSYFVDNDETVQGKKCFGIPVRAADALCLTGGIVFITPEKAQLEIIEQVKSYQNPKLKVVGLEELLELGEELYEEEYEDRASLEG